MARHHGRYWVERAGDAGERWLGWSTRCGRVRGAPVEGITGVGRRGREPVFGAAPRRGL